MLVNYTGFKVCCFTGFFSLPEKNNFVPMSKKLAILHYYKNIKETSLKVDCLAGFCHCQLALFKREQKQVCEQLL